MATIRQIKAIKKVSENGGNVSKAMRESGYSEITSATPKKLTTSKAWQELMAQYLPDKDLARVHQEGLEATTGGNADYGVRHRYLDTAYKLKGMYPKEDPDTPHEGIVVQVNYYGSENNKPPVQIPAKVIPVTFTDSTR